MRYNLHSIGSNGEGVANLELAGPKGSWRIVDETTGEVTFAEHVLRIKHMNRKITHLVHHRSCSDIRRGYPH